MYFFFFRFGNLDFLLLQEMCRQAKIEFAEETRKAKELHDTLMDARAQAKYIKRYNICSEVNWDSSDFSEFVSKYKPFVEPNLRCLQLKHSEVFELQGSVLKWNQPALRIQDGK